MSKAVYSFGFNQQVVDKIFSELKEYTERRNSINVTNETLFSKNESSDKFQHVAPHTMDLSEIDFTYFNEADWSQLILRINKTFKPDPNSGEFFTLSIANNQSLRFLPDCISKIEGSFLLDLQNLENFESINSNKLPNVFGIQFINLPKLTSIPSKFGELDAFKLTNLPNVKEIPKGLTFCEEAEVSMTDLTGLCKIPEGIFNMGDVNCWEIDISSKFLDPLSKYELFRCYFNALEDFQFEEFLKSYKFKFQLAKNLYSQKDLIFKEVDQRIGSSLSQSSPTSVADGLSKPLNKRKRNQDRFEYFNNNQEQVFREIFNRIYEHFSKKNKNTSMELELFIKSVSHVKLEEIFDVLMNRCEENRSNNTGAGRNVQSHTIG